MGSRALTIALFAMAAAFAACKKDSRTEGAVSEPAPVTTPVTPPPTPTVAEVAHVMHIDFTAFANNGQLVSDTKDYTNLAGDTLTVSKFNYYVSNVQLK